MGKMLIPLRSCVVATTGDTQLGMLYFDVDWDCPLDVARKSTPIQSVSEASRINYDAWLQGKTR